LREGPNNFISNQVKAPAFPLDLNGLLEYFHDW
jgi:hypothetical protein